MTRQRTQRWLLLFSIGLLGITSLSASAQDFEPEEDRRIVVTGTRRIAYVAPGADGTTDIHVIALGDEVGLIDQDNDPTTPRVLDPDDYTITNITSTPGANEIDPMFSPGGNLILYRGEADPTNYPGVNSLFVSDSDGLDKVQITANGVNVLYGTFSPDGTQVAFSAQWGSSQYKIYRSDLDGGNQFTLTPGEGFNAAFPLWRLNASGTVELAYIRIEGGMSQIVGIDPLTAEEQWSTDAITQAQAWILQPLYGEYATFIQRENSDSAWNVATINLDTRDVTQITDNPTNTCCLTMPVVTVFGEVRRGNVQSSEMPDGRRIFIVSNLLPEGEREIYRVDFDAANPANLTETSDFCATASLDDTATTDANWTVVTQDVNTGEVARRTQTTITNFCAALFVYGLITEPNWTVVAQNSTGGETAPLTETTISDFCATWLGAEGTTDPNWTVVAQNSTSGETRKLTENAIDSVCAVWSVDGTITTDMTALGSSPAYLADWRLVAQNTTTGETEPLDETMTAVLCESYRVDTGDPNWRLVAQNSDTGEIAQLNENAINNFCEAWSVDGVVISDMAAIGALPAYYLSDTEDGGRDIYSIPIFSSTLVNLSDTEEGGQDIYSIPIFGSNLVNLTASDDREYTSVVPLEFANYTGFDERENASVDTLFGNTLLVGYNEFEDDRTVPRLGLWRVSGNYGLGDNDLVGNYEFTDFVEGSDPDVVDPISLEQIEQMAADGLLRTCTLTVGGDGFTFIFSNPGSDTTIVRTVNPGDTVQVNAFLPGGPGNPAGSYRLTDGTWISGYDLTATDDCPTLPTISRASVGL